MTVSSILFSSHTVLLRLQNTTENEWMWCESKHKNLQYKVDIIYSEKGIFLEKKKEKKSNNQKRESIYQFTYRFILVFLLSTIEIIVDRILTSLLILGFGNKLHYFFILLTAAAIFRKLAKKRQVLFHLNLRW